MPQQHSNDNNGGENRIGIDKDKNRQRYVISRPAALSHKERGETELAAHRKAAGGSSGGGGGGGTEQASGSTRLRKFPDRIELARVCQMVRSESESARTCVRERMWMDGWRMDGWVHDVPLGAYQMPCVLVAWVVTSARYDTACLDST